MGVQDLYSTTSTDTTATSGDGTAGGDYGVLSTTVHDTTKTGNRKVSDLEALSVSTALAYYPAQVRLCYLWFAVLGLYSHTDAKNFGSVIKEIGNMEVIKTYSAGDDDTKYIFDCLAYTGAGGFPAVAPQEYIDYVKSEDQKNGRGTNNPSFYFMLAKFDLDLFNKQEERDVRRAKNFLGRYFYRSYDKMAVAGGDNENTQVNIQAGGASAQFHPRGEYIQQTPIFSFGHKPTSTIGKIESTLGTDSTTNNTNITTPSGTKESKIRTLKSFILLDRSDAAKYSPHENEFEDWKDTWKWYEHAAPQMIGNDGRPDIITLLDGESLVDPSIRLFLVREVNSGVFTYSTGTADNPWDKGPKTRHRSYEGLTNNASGGGADFPVDNDTDARYGLMSPQSVSISLPASLVVIPPSQSISLSGNSGAGFRVIVKCDSAYQKVVPKFQKTAYINVADTNVAKVDYIYKEIDADTLIAITNQQECLPKDNDIKTYVDKFGSYMKTTNSSQAGRASVRALGVLPLSYGIDKGLVSAQITMGENGVYTDYTFEDQIIVPPSDDVIQSELIRQQRINPVMGSSLSNNKMTSWQYADVGRATAASNTFNKSIISLTSK